MNWIAQHSSPLLVLANVATLAVWLFYAQLLYLGVRRARTPRVLITQGVASAGSSRCMVTNMSVEPVFVQCIVAHLKTNYGHRTCSVTDFYANQSQEIADSLKAGAGQGPLQRGSYLDIGTVTAMVDEALQAPLTRLTDEIKTNNAPEHALALKIYVIANYTFEDGEVGARRTFELLRDESGDLWRARPAYVSTQQLRDGKSRQLMRTWLRKFL